VNWSNNTVFRGEAPCGKSSTPENLQTVLKPTIQLQAEFQSLNQADKLLEQRPRRKNGPVPVFLLT
jgi:hypothetical protein